MWLDTCGAEQQKGHILLIWPSCEALPFLQLEFADPDVAEFDGVLVPLQEDWSFLWVGFRVLCEFLIDGWAVEFLVVVDDHAIVDDSDKCRALQFAISIFGSGEEDIVALPFSLRSGGIDHGWSLAVEGAGLTVGVGDIGVAFLDLHLVFIHQEDTAVSSLLILNFTTSGDFPLDVELAVAKALFGFVSAR